MRNDCVCPKCDGRKIYVCENTQPDNDSSNVIHPLFVITVPIAKDDLGVEEGSRYRSHIGRYETWICAGCGYTEWYAKDYKALLEKLAQTNDGVRVATPGAASPYR